MSRAETAAALKAHLDEAGRLADLLGADDFAAMPDLPPLDLSTAEPAPPAITAPPPGEDATNAFADYGKFYDYLRGNKMLGPVISTSEFAGCDAILRACALVQSPLAFVAYQLATPYLETSHTMLPIKEYGGNAYYTRLYDVNGQNPDRARKNGNVLPGDGPRYCGRGLVQLTWKNNYAHADKRLHELGILKDGESLVDTPDLAMRPDVAGAILVVGMQEGWFTGKKLADYLPTSGPADLASFTTARRIINGLDRANDIAGYAMQFQAALQAGGWRF